VEGERVVDEVLTSMLVIWWLY